MKLVLVLLAAIYSSARTSADPHQGTTPNIKDVFIGRCWDYDETRYNGILPRVPTDCETLWNLFFEAFSFKAPCDVKEALYEPFLQAAKQILPTNKTMFWSGVYNLAHRYSETGIRFVTLEDTLIGYLAHSLTWCGQEITPGMNYSRCPSWADCPSEASESFWAGASSTFAGESSGQVVLMIDGSNPNKPAYRRDSFFGKYELPTLNVSKVPSVHVIVTHALDKPKLEVCGSGSLLTLEVDVLARGLTFSCDDDPDYK
ncbi:hypothetical protein Btru_053117 [Bulinus truncatus]|nr:hypothetical protein Btru_053117 [Bulinus truncatus]